MPHWTVQDDSGNTLVLEGDSEPTEQELEEIFSSQRFDPAPDVPDSFAPPDRFGDSLLEGAAALAGQPEIDRTLPTPINPQSQRFTSGADIRRAYREEPTPNPTRAISSAMFPESEPEDSLLGISPEMVPSGKGPVTVPLASVGRTAAGIAGYMTSPDGITELVAAMSPAKLLVMGKWAVDMAKGAGEETGTLSTLVAKPDKTLEDWQQISDHTANSLAMIFGAGKVGSEIGAKATGIRAPVGRALIEPATIGRRGTLAKDLAQRLSEAEMIPLERAALPENIGGAIGGASENLPAEAQAIEAENKAKMRADFQKELDAQSEPTIKPAPIDSSLTVEPIKETGGVTSDPLTAPVSGEQPLVPTPGKTVVKESLTPEQAYDAAREAFKAPSRAFGEIQKAYRARQIGDAEFLAGKKTFDEAMAAFDAAEDKFIAAKNKPTPPVETPVAAVEKVKEVIQDVAAAPTHLTGDFAAKNKEIGRIAREKAEAKASAKRTAAAKAIKTELVQRLEKAIEDSPAEASLEPRQQEALAAAREGERTGGIKGEGSERRRSPEAVDAAERAGLNRITIEIPGDGTFTVWKTKEALSEIRDRAKNISTSTEPGQNFRRQGISKEDKEWVAEQVKNQPAPKPTETAGEDQGTISGPPLATLPPVAAIPPKAISQIIRDLSKAVGSPIRFGRLTTRKFGGYFKPLANLIGAKRPNDIQVVTHEVGHRLDQTFKLVAERAFAAELMALGDNTRAGSRSSWTPSKTQLYRKNEGMAEFIRYWLTEPAEATRLAPSLSAHFDRVLKRYPDLEAQLVQAREDILNWSTAEPQARLMSNVSVGANPNKTRYTLKDLTRDVLDDLHYLKLAVEDVKALGGGTLEPSNNPYVMARLLRGAYGVADTFLNRGTVDFKTRNVTAGNSFQDVLKPVSGRLNDFRAYIIARQAREMRAQGKETGLEAGDVDFTYNKFRNDAEFNTAFDNLKQWSDSFIQYAVDAGYLSPESAANMRRMNQEYVPFNRIFEIGADEFGEPGGGVGRGLNQVGSAFKARRGSRRDIVDPLENYVKNAYSIILNSEKNAVNVSLADLAGKPGFGRFVEKIATPKEHVGVLVEKVREELERNGADLTGVPDDLVLTLWKDSKIAPRGENIIKVNRAGKLEFYRLSPELYKTMNALDHESASMLSKIVSAPAQVLRAGVTLTPDFAIANATRDTFSSAIISRYGKFPIEHTLRGLYALLKDPQLVSEWKASGGGQSVEAHYYDRASMQKFLQSKISKDFSYADYVKFVASSPLKALRILSGTLEEATRIGEYKRVYDALTKKGMAEGDARRQAGFESRDLQDFAMGGAKTKSLRRATAFFNAALQGEYRLYQSLKDPATRYQTVLKGMAWVTVPTVTLFLINKDDPDYWDRPQWERDLFWMIPRGKDELGHTQFLRVPKPFTLGLIFGTVPERAMAKWFNDDPRAFDGLAGQFVNQTIPNPVPQALLTVAEISAGPEGYSWYKHRPIVPKRLERMPAELQFSQQNSVTAKRIGKALGVSPMKVDHAIAGTIGTLGKTAVNQGVDRVLEWLTDDERTARSTYPGARFIATPAGTQSQSVENFYTELGRLREEHARKKKPGVTLSQGNRLDRFEKASEKLSDLRSKQRKATDDIKRQKIALQMRTVAENALR